MMRFVYTGDEIKKRFCYCYLQQKGGEYIIERVRLFSDGQSERLRDKNHRFQPQKF